ncbi:hypothetical protein [Paraburkholderia silvatlantica]|uniref:Uncharacterized protein n=1 Tax=Paraburkholderia silvatlantica TaxID=321895 RepID=A0ABR6FX70_9BURK|nr:hypothetical protein [Paraburkholderia silvatlantica]MBB2932034.1 hypothetical protein [Paraburkholderia silvatlantica]
MQSTKQTRLHLAEADIRLLDRIEDSVNYKLALDLLLDYWTEAPVRRRAEWPYHKPTIALRQRTEIDNMVEWVRVAAQNRSDYPGWLVAPSANRVRIEQNFSRLAIPVIRAPYTRAVSRSLAEGSPILASADERTSNPTEPPRTLPSLV